MEDSRWLAKDVSGRPTCLAEVVPEVPLYNGTSDAAGRGAGRVWLPEGDNLYQAAVQADTLAPSLATDRGPAVAAVVADRAAARALSPASTVGNFGVPAVAQAAPDEGKCACPDSLPPASVTRRDRPPLDGPILWRHEWPPEIAAQLVSFDNPAGTINNSELELAGTLAGNDVLAREVDVAETTTATGTDNAAGLSWSTKGAVSTTAPASYLLRLSSMHQRTHRYQQRNFFIPGEANGMADDCSRLWHLDNQELLAHFESTYPQSKPWRLCRLNADTASAIHAALLCQRRPLPEAMPALPPREEEGHAQPTKRGGAWHLQASPAAHGHRKRLFETLGKRRNSWVTASAASVMPPSTTVGGGSHH